MKSVFPAVVPAIVLAVAVCVGFITPTALANGDPARGIALTNDGSFNYQGQLEFNGVPANGVYYFRFSLFDSAGTWLGAWWANSGPITVTNGLFDIDIQMGDDPTIAREFWKEYGDLVKELEIEVGEVEGIYTTLAPRVKIGSSPQALHSQFAKALIFPYTDSYARPTNSPVTMISLTHTNGGTVLEAIEGVNTDDPIISVKSATPNGIDFASQSGGIHVDAQGRRVGLLSISDEVPIAGVLMIDPGVVSVAVLGQVFPGVPLGTAIRALNSETNTLANLGTPLYAGDFSGDVLARTNLRVQGQPTRDYALNSPSPIGPLAYASVSFAGTVSTGTANISVSWSPANQWYVVSVSGETMSFPTHTVSITVVDTAEPRLATFNATNGDILVKIWDINSGNIAVQDNFSIVIYDANPVFINRMAVPDGVDLDKYIEKTGITPIQTRPQNEPVEPIENYGMGISVKN